MAYSKAWNESAPSGSANANTLDTIIQDLKISMRERLEDLINDWTNDGVDPKTFNADKLFPIGKEQVGLKITSAKTITTAASPLTDISWDAADFEVGENFWTSGTQITIVNAGRYLINLNVRWTANATGIRTASIRKNASVYLCTDYIPDADGTVQDGHSLCWIGALAASDTIIGSVAQTSGGNLNVVTEGTTIALMRIA